MNASADSIRDAYALVQTSLTGDQAEHDAVLACCDQAEVARVLADTVAETFSDAVPGAVGRRPLVLVARVREALPGRERAVSMRIVNQLSDDCPGRAEAGRHVHARPRCPASKT